MSRLRFQAKANGLMIMKGKWLRAIVILLLIILLISGFLALESAYRSACGVPLENSNGSYNISSMSLIIETVFALLVLLFVPPIIMGQAEWYWSLTDLNAKGIGEVFGWFGSLRLYFKSVALALLIFVRFLFWAILTCVLPAAMIAAGYYYFYPENIKVITLNTFYFVMLVIFGSVLLLSGILLLCFIMMRYFLCVFLLVEDNKRNLREVIKTSLRYTKKFRWEIYKFFLSFIFWFISCYFILPMFFVIPYFNASSSVLAKHIIYTRRAIEKEDSLKNAVQTNT